MAPWFLCLSSFSGAIRYQSKEGNFVFQTKKSYLAKALLKLVSKPVSTKISYKNGDDGNGNIRFPAVTICLNDYNYISRGPKVVKTVFFLFYISIIFLLRERVNL